MKHCLILTGNLQLFCNYLSCDFGFSIVQGFWINLNCREFSQFIKVASVPFVYLSIYQSGKCIFLCGKIFKNFCLNPNITHSKIFTIYQSGKVYFCIFATLVKMILPPFGAYFWILQFTKGRLLEKKPFTNVANCQYSLTVCHIGKWFFSKILP